MNTSIRDDRIFPETRIAVIPVILVLLSAFITLFFWPDDTERLFAWTITPRMTPLLMASGYLAGAYAFSHLLIRGVRWHHVAFSFLAVEPFTVAMAGATILHWDRFHHDQIWFWVWVVVYAATPLLLPVLWLRNRVTDPGTPDPDDALLPKPARWVLRLGGWVGVALTAFLFLLPEQAIQVWPWTLTPLTARVIGGWYALSGATALVIARDPRWSAARIAVRGSLVFAGMLLVSIVRAWGDFDPSNLLTWVYVGTVVFTVAGFGALYAIMESRRKAAARLSGEQSQPA
ncbi:MAG TPA: hypothetical protein VJG32_20580 [Anaerolineae bacterium]|nr:hypothetical protein [Anaerolineae bacterium]